MAEKKYRVKVYDNGFVIMGKYVDGEWKYCEFSTREEAEKALSEYKAIWHRNGYVFEV